MQSVRKLPKSPRKVFLADLQHNSIVQNGYIDVGDFMLVIIVRCWWRTFDIGDIFWLSAMKTVKILTNISKLSPTHFVSNISHQHRCNQFFASVADWFLKNVFFDFQLTKNNLSSWGSQFRFIIKSKSQNFETGGQNKAVLGSFHHY